MCRRSCLRAGALCQPPECQPSAAVVGWQTLTRIPTGLDLTESYTGITLPPELGTIGAASEHSHCFDDIALFEDGTAAPSSDCLALAGDSIERYLRFTVGLRAGY